MFDINDFDETLPGPWEWDIKRLAASFEIAGRDRGFTAAAPARVVLAATRSTGPDEADLPRCATWMSGTPISSSRACSTSFRPSPAKQATKARANLAKARTRDSMQAFAKLTHIVDGERSIIADPPLVVPIEDLLPAGSERDDIEAEIRGIISGLPEHA